MSRLASVDPNTHSKKHNFAVCWRVKRTIKGAEINSPRQTKRISNHANHDNKVTTPITLMSQRDETATFIPIPTKKTTVANHANINTTYDIDSHLNNVETPKTESNSQPKKNLIINVALIHIIQ